MPGLLHHHRHTQSGPHLLQLGLQGVRACVHASEYVFVRLTSCMPVHEGL